MIFLYGFFGFGNQPTSASQMVTCPNCGRHLHVATVENHECVRADVDTYHVGLFDAEFEPAGALYAWVAFRRWQETPPGRFALWLVAH